MANDPSDPAGGFRPAHTPPGTSLTLLHRLRDNQPEAWRVVVVLYTPLVYHWRPPRRAGADAEDVAQEVFQAAAAGLARFRREREGDTFRGWLCGITRNVLLQHFRRTNHQPQASGGTDALARLQDVAEAEPPDADEDDSPSDLEALRRRALDLVRGQVEERTWRLSGSPPSRATPPTTSRPAWASARPPCAWPSPACCAASRNNSAT